MTEAHYHYAPVEMVEFVHTVPIGQGPMPHERVFLRV